MKKSIILVVMISLFLNGFVPRYSFFSRGYDTAFSFLGNHPLLQCYFSLSTIPIAVVEKLLHEDVRHASRPQGQPEKPAPASNTSAEFSLAVAGQKGIVRGQAPQPAGGNGSALAPAMDARASMYDRMDSYSCSPGGGGSGIWALFMLMLLIMLPRGSLGDGYSIRCATILRENPVWRNSKLGFLFGGNK